MQYNRELQKKEHVIFQNTDELHLVIFSPGHTARAAETCGWPNVVHHFDDWQSYLTAQYHSTHINICVH